MDSTEYEVYTEYTTIMDGDGTLHLEAKAIDNSYIVMNEIYPKVREVLSTKVGDSKFKQLVGRFIDKNSERLHTPGPQYMIPFGDIDKGMFYKLFNTTEAEMKVIVAKVCEIIKVDSNATDFRLLKNNPLFFIFYCVIRYYTIETKDVQGVNTALAMYALSVYPSIFDKYFKHGVSDVPAMLYTVDNLTEKFILKKSGHVFGMLMTSISSSYDFLKQFMNDASDKEVIRFIQRIRNDQNSLVKKICDSYLKNHAAGNRLVVAKDQIGDAVAADDRANNTMIVESITNKIAMPIITNGIDLTRAEIAAKLAKISIADCRFYIAKILTNENQATMVRFVQAALFMFLYTDKHKVEEINSSLFLTWSAELFRKTNSNDDNIVAIKTILDEWAESIGVHAKFKREASRINYKKAIFFYFILSIQKYNK